MVWLGLRSYSFYLWHWPILMLTRPHLDVRSRARSWSSSSSGRRCSSPTSPTATSSSRSATGATPPPRPAGCDSGGRRSRRGAGDRLPGRLERPRLHERQRRPAGERATAHEDRHHGRGERPPREACRASARRGNPRSGRVPTAPPPAPAQGPQRQRRGRRRAARMAPSSRSATRSCSAPRRTSRDKLGGARP